MNRLMPRTSTPIVRLICLVLCCALFVPCFPLTFDGLAASTAPQGIPDPPGPDLPDLDFESQDEPKEPEVSEPVPSTLPNCSPDDPDCGGGYSLNAVGNAPPVVNITSPQTGNSFTAPASITISASASDPDGTIANVSFYSNGVFIKKDTSAPYSIVWSNVGAGTYNLTARATDNGNKITTSATVTITVGNSTPPNTPPIANPGGPYSGTPGVAVQFNGSGSFDPNGSIVSYQWNFGDSTTGSGATPSKAYSTAGNYNVTLTVTDNQGATRSASTIASITSTANLPPTANPGGPYSGTVGVAVQFNGSASSDSDGTIVSYFWDFDDGTTSTSPTPAHAFNIVGTYDITLTVTDDDGAQRSATTTATITLATSGDNFSNARVDNANRTGQPGEDLFSGNFNWGVPLLGLKGRSGLDLGLSLVYNSLVWTRSGNSIKYNADNGFPSPGFRLGFPTIQPRYLSSLANVNAYLMIMPLGARVELRQVGTTNVYESADSSYIQLTEGANPLVRMTDGTHMLYSLIGSEYRCIEIKDRNGNFISINYNSNGRLSSITDTPGRVVNFNYDTFQNVISITQHWNGVAHTWATFGYENIQIQTNFPGLTVVGPPNGTMIPVLKRVGLHDGSSFTFDYTSWGQVHRINHYAADNHLRNYTRYNLPLNASVAQSDCPRFTERRDWAEAWNLQNQIPQEVITTFAFASDRSWGEATLPDETRSKEYFFTSSWQKGLPSKMEVISAGAVKKTTAFTWTQDNINLSYRLNPRVTETNVSDDAGNNRKTRVTYTTFGLPSDVEEFAANGTNVLRRTHTDYNLTTTYTSRRIIGLVSAQFVYEGTSTLMSKVEYTYDMSGEFLVNQGTTIRHDSAGFGAGLVQGRGNLCKVKRYDITNNSFVESATGYNIAGSPIFTRDALSHQVTISYTDSFSDQMNRNTRAYPTMITDQNGFATTSRYYFDQGLIERTQDQKGATLTRTYDTAMRISRLDSDNGGYRRWVYPTHQRSADSHTLVQIGAAELYSTQQFDGLGRVRANASSFPDSTGLYRGQYTVYNVMGRAVSQSNPTEMRSDWTAAGDDASAGWIYTNQNYDWQGRPRVTTNTDSTTREVSYGGCGCAGGQTVTIRDEMNRRQRMTYDVLGRAVKEEVLNLDQSVYSTTTTTYNARDQVTEIMQRQGVSGTGQQTLMTYDGHGRLKTRKAPAETNPVQFNYNPDDTLQVITDPRGAKTTYSYNARKLVTAITYTKPSTAAADDIGPTAVPNPGAVAFGYDEAGNRLWMTDGQGRTDYQYDKWSRLQWEERLITDLARSYRLTYTFNLAGELTSLAGPFNSSVGYSYDHAGQLTTVTGSGSGSAPTYISQISYRAWGAPKQINYGNNKVMSLSYNPRLQVSSFQIPSVMGATFTYYADGRVHRSTDTVDRAFDRAYAYDHIGRLSEALSGNEAGTGSTKLGPYRQQYQYDVWSNMKTRSGRLWSEADDIYITNYVNDRNTAWSYDEAGNEKLMGGVENTFDVAGRLNRTVSPLRRVGTQVINITLDNRFDGDGLLVRQSTNGTAKYFVRSSVLGGREVAELNQAGNKIVVYTYANGQVVAKQQSGGSVVWQHYNPTNINERQTGSTGLGQGGAEYDPLHSSVGLFDPGPPLQPGGDGTSSDLLFPRSGDPTDLSGGCTWDGLAVPCSLAMDVLNSEAGVEGPAQTVRWNNRLNRGQGGFEIFKAFADGHSGFLPVNARYIGGGRFRLPPVLGGYEGNPDHRLRWNSTSDPGDGDAQQAAGQTRQPCTFNIQITNNAGLTGEQLRTMQNEIGRIFRASGHNVVFDQGRAAGGSFSLAFINPRHGNDAKIVGWTPLGEDETIKSNGVVSRLALIDSIQEATDRADKLLGSHPNNIAIGLGRAGAHEAGHYLLQMRGHINQGIMRPKFSGSQWWSAPWANTFQFTDGQSAQLSRRCEILRSLSYLLPW